MYNPPSQTRVGMKHASFFPSPSCSCSSLMCIYVAVSLSFFSVDVSSFLCACILWCRSVLACLHRRLPFKGISMLSLSFFSVWARSVVRRAFGVCAQSVVCFVFPSSASTGYQSMALVIWCLRTPSGQVRRFFSYVPRCIGCGATGRVGVKSCWRVVSGGGVWFDFSCDF